MTTLTVLPLLPATSRDARALERTRQRVGDELAGRTVWCVASLPDGREAAWELRACLRLGSGEDVAVGCIDISTSEPLAELGRRLEAMLHGVAGSASALSAADGADYRDACGDGEAMLGREVSPDDIVVLHDALAAVTAEAARDRGAHVVWRYDDAAPARPRSATEAWDFIRPLSRGVDGYIGEWLVPGAAPGRIGAVMPSTGAVAARDVGASDVPVGWSSALADIVQADRHETVGGTVHARPAVAIR